MCMDPHYEEKIFIMGISIMVKRQSVDCVIFHLVGSKQPNVYKHVWITLQDKSSSYV